MKWSSVNPATGEVLQTYALWDDRRLEQALSVLPEASAAWGNTAPEKRAELLRAAARGLRAESESHARLITLEMGKLIHEARAEIEKCASACAYYAEHGARLLADESVDSDASRSYVSYRPLGSILAIMPWNFPFWQILRATLPPLLAGNTILLKPAPNVYGCALALQRALLEAGFPPAVFQVLPLPVEAIPRLLADSRIHGVTFTGSVRAGREVAKHAGTNLKKTVLELGGSDPFIILEDADLERSAAQALIARFMNSGQSCVAAKRFIVVEAVADAFVARFRSLIDDLRAGDPLHESTTLAPLARADLRETLQRQVTASIAAGAVPLSGCTPLDGRGNFYRASLLDRVRPGQPAFDEELFGPVATIVRARDEAEAIRLANHSRYGLGGSVWTADAACGERIARQLQCGMSFVNGIVKSDPRLPCGGIKDSGYGRELSYFGLREFTNPKVVWIA